MLTWTLNGTSLGEYRGLSPEVIYNLVYVGRITGVEVFEAPDMPEGALDLFSNGARYAHIRGLQKQKDRPATTITIPLIRENSVMETRQCGPDAVRTEASTSSVSCEEVSADPQEPNPVVPTH